MARQLTPAAQAAKIIRKNLKAQGLVCRVTSENYSMGCSVNVKIYDQQPKLYKLVESYCKNFQYGHFDGMIDCYEHSNSRDDIPQAKFVFVKNELSDELKEKIYQSLRTQWFGGEELPATYEQGRNLMLQGTYVSQFVWREFSQEDSLFWNPVNRATQKAAA